MSKKKHDGLIVGNSTYKTQELANSVYQELMEFAIEIVKKCFTAEIKTGEYDQEVRQKLKPTVEKTALALATTFEKVKDVIY